MQPSPNSEGAGSLVSQIPLKLTSFKTNRWFTILPKLYESNFYQFISERWFKVLSKLFQLQIIMNVKIISMFKNKSMFKAKHQNQWYLGLEEKWSFNRESIEYNDLMSREYRPLSCQYYWIFTRLLFMSKSHLDGQFPVLSLEMSQNLLACVTARITTELFSTWYFQNCYLLHNLTRFIPLSQFNDHQCFFFHFAFNRIQQGKIIVVPTICNSLM